jgi:hypothetical protein
MEERMATKNNTDPYTGLLFELKIGLNDKNSIVIDYGGKPVGKIREALRGFPYQANLCAAIINHANSLGKKLEDDVKKIIQTL